MLEDERLRPGTSTGSAFARPAFSRIDSLLARSPSCPEISQSCYWVRYNLLVTIKFYYTLDGNEIRIDVSSGIDAKYS